MFYATHNPMTMAQRITRERKRLKLSQQQLADLVGVGQTAVSNWEVGKREPEEENIQALADVFGCTAIWLRYNIDNSNEKKLARLRGYVGTGDIIHMFAEDVIDYVEAPKGSEVSFEAFEIKGNSQYPVYRDGDLVYYNPTANSRVLELIGRDCVIELADGRLFLKRLEYGSRAGLYNLASYGTPEIRDQAVRSAAEILWLKRAKL